MIKTNEWQQAHQIKERVVERIACEMRGHGTGIIRQRQIYDELLSEFYELRQGQEARFPKGEQIPQSVVNVMPDEAELIVYDGVMQYIE